MDTEQLQKCTIVNLDEGKQIPAQYNPKSIKIGKAAQWDRKPSVGGNADMLSFGNTKNRTLSFELFFDGFEDREYRKGDEKSAKKPVNVERKYVEPLTKLMLPDQKRESGKSGEKAKRPPFIMVVWGCMRPFRGVIDKIDYEFSMFSPDGTPVRATATISVIEVHILQMTGKHKDNFEGSLGEINGSGSVEEAASEMGWG